MAELFSYIQTLLFLFLEAGPMSKSEAAELLLSPSHLVQSLRILRLGQLFPYPCIKPTNRSDFMISTSGKRTKDAK